MNGRRGRASLGSWRIPTIDELYHADLMLIRWAEAEWEGNATSETKKQSRTDTSTFVNSRTTFDNRR